MSFKFSKDDLKKINMESRISQFLPSLLGLFAILAMVVLFLLDKIDENDKEGFKSDMLIFIMVICIILCGIFTIVKTLIKDKKRFDRIPNDEIRNYSITFDGEVYKYEDLSIGNVRVFKKNDVLRIKHSKNFTFVYIIGSVLAFPGNNFNLKDIK